MINLGLGACVDEAEDEKEEEQYEADTDEIEIIGGDFIPRGFNCLPNRALKTFGVTRPATTKHGDFVILVA